MRNRPDVRSPVLVIAGAPAVPAEITIGTVLVTAVVDTLTREVPPVTIFTVSAAEEPIPVFRSLVKLNGGAAVLSAAGPMNCPVALIEPTEIVPLIDRT